VGSNPTPGVFLSPSFCRNGDALNQTARFGLKRRFKASSKTNTKMYKWTLQLELALIELFRSPLYLRYTARQEWQNCVVGREVYENAGGALRIATAGYLPAARRARPLEFFLSLPRGTLDLTARHMSYFLSLFIDRSIIGMYSRHKKTCMYSSCIDAEKLRRV